MPEPKLRGLISKWLERANGPEPPIVTLRVRSTAGWGCPCPPFALRRTGDVFLFSEVPPTVLDPETPVLHAGPKMEFVLEGSYTGGTATLESHAAAKGEPPLEGDGLGAAPPSPVFRVSRWCVRLPADSSGDYAASASFAEANGLLCPK
jgi:hypothetical protein